MKLRLPAVAGEWIKRDRAIAFRFEGEHYSGFEGDTASSALLANDVRLLGRSFKYHRPRSVLSLANHDANILLQDGQRLNLRGDVEPLVSDMDLVAVNTFGGVANDRASVLDRLSKLFPVGFYYKAFHTPKVLFPFWERLIRRISGLGRLDPSTPRLRTPKRYDYCDVLVIGAGPSGLAAAIAAGATGARVVVVDENARAGGSLGYQRGAGDVALTTFRSLEARLATLPNVSVRTATQAAGYYADHWIPLVEGGHITKMRAKSLVVASGVIEQPAVFRNNDLPGVMLASAAQRLIYRYAVKPMQRVVVLAANTDAYAAALDLAAHGVGIAAIVDLRPRAEAADAAATLQREDVRIMDGACIYEALGKGSVTAAVVCPLRADGEADVPRAETIPCDGIVMSVGYAGATGLLYQAGGKMAYDETLTQFVPDVLPEGIFAAGRVNGVYALEDRLQDGERAGCAAARHAGFELALAAPVVRARGGINHPYPVIPHPRGKNFVDFDEDLQLADFAGAAQEGFDNIELLKRYTTVGMGPSQGKHSNLNALRVLARILGQSPAVIGTTTARPFYHPVPLSHLAGRGFHAHRETPLHARHDKLDAVFMNAGDWLRPEYYALSGRGKAEAVLAEARAVREAVGIIDVGTLGKIEAHGPEAAALLERVYTGRFANLKTGMTRYALMLDESGVIVDDGVVARLGEESFYFTTTTTGSAAIYRELGRLNTQWRLQAGIVNVTGHMAAMNLAGPRAREVLASCTSIDLSAAAFPYLGVRCGEVAGVPARLMRVGFVGELGYEIHVPAAGAGCVWDALMEAGQGFGIRPFGVEAQRLLRLEKGHVIIGQDTDGLTTPLAADMQWALKMDKDFFIGQRSLKAISKKTGLQKLVGFTLKAEGTVPKECHLVIRDGGIAGRVTSIAWSPALGCHIGLAYVAAELAAPGSCIAIRADGGHMVEAVVVKAPFYDPAGERQKIAA
jgi:sarcosine oxidase subunit alpha